MKINTSVEIEFTERDIKQLILDKVSEHDNRIAVDDIKFKMLRSPATLHTEVVAHVGESVAENTLPEPVLSRSEVQVDLEDIIEDFKEAEVPPLGDTVEDIFAKVENLN